jgi:hypothetical protein
MTLLMCTLGLAGLACSLGGALAGSPIPSTEAPPEAASPTPTVVSTPAGDPLIVTHAGSEFDIYALDGTLLETRSAAGLSWARPNTAQVVGREIYFVAEGAGEAGAVVRRVTSTETADLEFTRSGDPTETVAFAVSDDEARIAWAQTSWAGGPPFSQLWMAGMDGTSPVLIAQTEPQDDIAEFFVLEPVMWLDDGDLVFSWQVTGIGGYILFFGWSSLYRYDVASGTITPVAPLAPDVVAPCWTDLTGDGAFAAGACGAAGEVLERNTQTGVDTVFPALPDQGQAGAASYAPQGTRLGYAIARGDPEDEAGQLVLVPARGEALSVIASHAPGAFDEIEWIDEARMAVGYWQGDGSFVDLVAVDGSRRAIGQGRLIGLMR